MTVAVIAVIATTISGRPDPATVARLEEEGAPNPERYFSQIVEELAEAGRAWRGSRRRHSGRQ
jgi:hypothetical protein